MYLLDTLTDKQKQSVRYKYLSKGQILFREDDICEYVGIVTEGELSIISILNNGNSIIYNIIKKDGLFGNNLIFSSNPFYRGDITATKDSIVGLIYKSDLKMLLKQNDDFLMMYMEIQSDFGKQLNSRIKLLSIDSASERFMYYLHLNKGVIRYTSISKLALELNLQRETLSRIISRLEKDNIIVREKKTIKAVKE